MSFLVSQILNRFQLNVFDTQRGRAKRATRVRRDADKKPAKHKVIYKPVYARCLCSEQAAECVPFLTAPEVKETLCICYYDIYTRTAWPCYSEKNWRSEWCSHCNFDGYCSAAITDQYNLSHTPSEPCICNGFTSHCLATRNETFGSMWTNSLKPKEWYPYVTTPPPSEPPPITEPAAEVTEDPTYLEAMGFEGVTDDIAKAGIAQENTLFIMANLSDEVKTKLSYGKQEFIQQCSFNGRQCNVESYVDFKIHIDPVFGNCYKFNADVTHKRSTTRAGPMYGLSLVVYVDVDDYLPTTKAAGVRVAVHPQEEYPFPDTFGYNAPTGLQSSFGIRLKKIERLPQPYGDCIREGKTEDYIYRDYVYTLEGCYRSCFQHTLIEKCGCGDPRFPVPVGQQHCRVDDGFASNSLSELPSLIDLTRPSSLTLRFIGSCLQNATREVGGLHGHFTSHCVCQQPCT
ncbi:unnamed protein product [Soboliphyme baturini]|uniref:Amiloride-sensitive sodium channel n=1 Tax=Soboliphyme baturini TaxID=241478 RepID=A0A183J7B0_9BILA|nr:unnamed protein product [Soboliphyme baturini]